MPKHKTPVPTAGARKHFEKIQQDLLSENPLIRAQSALHVAQFALLERPVRANKRGRRSSKTEDFPYFTPSIAYLTTALRLEENADVRASAVQALQQIAALAAGSKRQRLLHKLIEMFADTNRAAKATFVQALADYSVVTAPDDEAALDLGFVASLVPFCVKRETTRACLLALIEEDTDDSEQRQPVDRSPSLTPYPASEASFRALRALSAARRKTMDESQRQRYDHRSASQLQTSGLRLISNRDVLAYALRALRRPKNVPKCMPEDLAAIRDKLQPWRFAPSFLLWGCFLAGTDLAGANLHGVDLSRAHLQGAFLKNVRLPAARLRKAYLTSANLIGAQIQGAMLHHARMRHAYLVGGRMETADMSCADLRDAEIHGVRMHEASLWGTDLRGATLLGSELQGADLRLAKLQGANLMKANLQGTRLGCSLIEGALLYGMVVQEQDSPESRRTNFSQTRWRAARFDTNYDFQIDPDADMRTERLPSWLEEAFPYTEEEAGQWLSYRTATVADGDAPDSPATAMSSEA